MDQKKLGRYGSKIPQIITDHHRSSQIAPEVFKDVQGFRRIAVGDSGFSYQLGKILCHLEDLLQGI